MNNYHGRGKSQQVVVQMMADVPACPLCAPPPPSHLPGAGHLAAAAGWYSDAYQAAAAMTDTRAIIPNPEISHSTTIDCIKNLQTLVPNLAIAAQPVKRINASMRVEFYARRSLYLYWQKASEPLLNTAKTITLISLLVADDNTYAPPVDNWPKVKSRGFDVNTSR